jgi:uncharacterized coiled-coil protein SlyX
MTDPIENEPTQQLPVPTVEARLTSLETGQATLQATLNEINSKLDILIKMQQDRYVDLRGRITSLDNNVHQRLTSMDNNVHQRLTSIESNLHQIQQDMQPDSFPNRLMRAGQ